MLNYIWAILIMVGIMVAAFTGTMENVSTGILDSSREAIQLCIVMLGVVGMWTGIMKLAEATGLVRQLTRLLMPILRLLFPRIAGDEKAMGYIATNMVANLLGLGWAATPTGLQAMKELLTNNREGVEITSGMLEQAKLASIMQYVVIIFASAPLLAVYPFIQKYFTKGVMIGSVKG